MLCCGSHLDWDWHSWLDCCTCTSKDYFEIVNKICPIRLQTNTQRDEQQHYLFTFTFGSKPWKSYYALFFNHQIPSCFLMGIQEQLCYVSFHFSLPITVVYCQSICWQQLHLPQIRIFYCILLKEFPERSSRLFSHLDPRALIKILFTIITNPGGGVCKWQKKCQQLMTLGILGEVREVGLGFIQPTPTPAHLLTNVITSCFIRAFRWDKWSQ